jgi:molybdopterin converting factor small subunit
MEQYKGEIVSFNEVTTVADLDTVKEEIKQRSAEIEGALAELDQVPVSKQEFIDKNKTKIKDEDISMFPRPKSSCKHCYGRGYWATDSLTKERQLCRCISNKVFKVFDQDQLLTYGELRKMMGTQNETISEVVQETTQASSEERASERS